jgi:glycosyltransferase involved in cell wall biosynthesis
MRILAFSNCPLDPNSGSGQTRLAWCEGLRELGHSVSVLDLGDLQIGGAGSRLRELRLSFGAFLRSLRQDISSFDLIEFYGAEFGLAVRWLSRKRNRPFLVQHSDGNEFAVDSGSAPLENGGLSGRRLYWAFAKHARTAAFRDVDALVAGSVADIAFARSRAWPTSGRARTVAIGLRPEFLSRPLPGFRPARVGFVGSWIEGKGIRMVVNTMIEVLHKLPQSEFCVVGCSISEKVVLQAFPPALHSRIAVYPRVDVWQMIELLESFSVFLFPSRYEGFGLALAEAMACGCAAVTTPTGFGAELTGEEAVIVQHDDTDTAVKAICRMLCDDEFRHGMACKGQVRANALKWNERVKELASIYSGWLAETEWMRCGGK